MKNQVSRLLSHFGVKNRAAMARELALAEGLAARDRALGSLAEIVPFGFAVTSGPQHVLRFASASLLKMLGSGAPGKPIRLIQDSRYRAAITLFDRVFESGETFSGRGTLDGSVPMNLVVMPMRRTTGVMEGLLLFALDVADA